MDRGGGVYAAVFSAAAFVVFWLCLSVCPSRASDDDEVRFLLFSGRDIWRNGAFVHGGILFAPGGIEQDGFLFKLVLSGGLYRYNAGDAAIGRV